MSKSSNLYLQTPLLQSTCLSNRYGYNVYLKLENVQPAGSFKIRGIGNRCKKVGIYKFTKDFRPISSWKYFCTFLICENNLLSLFSKMLGYSPPSTSDFPNSCIARGCLGLFLGGVIKA